jgi:hypothetical protein
VKTSAPHRFASSSPLRRNAWLSLVVSSIVAVACAFGTVWVARAGIVVAIAGGLLAANFAWQEIRASRNALLAQNSADSRAAAALLHTERAQHVRLLGVLQLRNADLRSKFNTARAEAAVLSQETAQLRGDKAALELELAKQQESAEAQVFAWPRRVTGHDEGNDLWGSDGAPTVVELQALANPPLPSAQQRQHA